MDLVPADSRTTQKYGRNFVKDAPRWKSQPTAPWVNYRTHTISDKPGNIFSLYVVHRFTHHLSSNWNISVTITWNILQTFVIPRGWRLLILVIPWRFLCRHPQVDVWSFECYISTITAWIDRKFDTEINVPPWGWTLITLALLQHFLQLHRLKMLV